MAKKKPIVLNGQRIGRFKASLLLFKETYRYFKADKEMVWIPLIMGVVNIFLFGAIVTVFVLTILGGDIQLSAEGEPSSPLELIFFFACYVAGAFTLALSQAAIVHTVYTRAHGGDATLTDSLKVAWSHAGSLLLWSVITSTVGIVLRMIVERSKFLGFILAQIVGVAWSVLTYFVVPAMVIDKKSAFGSIGKSGQVFKQTWGETLVSNFGLGLTFLGIHLLALLSFIGLAIACAVVDLSVLIVPLVIVYIVFIIIMGLIQSAMEGILKTLLYIYGAEGAVPENFNRDLLESMLARKAVLGAGHDMPQPPVA
jgi:hypothetical protein